MSEISDQSQCVMLCVFRSCNWQSEDVRGISLADQEHVVSEHLRHHRSEIALMYRAIS